MKTRINYWELLFSITIIVLYSSSCSTNVNEVTCTNNPLENTLLSTTPSNTIIPMISRFPTNKNIQTTTVEKQETMETNNELLISSLPECKTQPLPEGELILTGTGIVKIDMGCTEINNCKYESTEVFTYNGFILNATWSPDGKRILFAADIKAPPMREGTGGAVTEIRLFSISPNGGNPIVMSGRGGFVRQINSCRGVDRILYERLEDINKIYIIDSQGYGSAFAHEGKSVSNPSCSPMGNDIAFTTEEKQLFIKHIGNSIHTFVSDKAYGKATWSPDQRSLAFSYAESPTIKGTCLAITNLETGESPKVISPCPIPGTGEAPIWSTDGNRVLTYIYANREEPGEIIIITSPNKEGQLVDISQVIFGGLLAYHPSSIFVGPNEFLVVQGGEHPEQDEVIIINLSEKCIIENIAVPIGSGDPDWYPGNGYD